MPEVETDDVVITEDELTCCDPTRHGAELLCVPWIVVDRVLDPIVDERIVCASVGDEIVCVCRFVDTGEESAGVV